MTEQKKKKMLKKGRRLLDTMSISTTHSTLLQFTRYFIFFIRNLFHFILIVVSLSIPHFLSIQSHTYTHIAENH